MRAQIKKEKRIDAKTIYTCESLSYDQKTITTDTDEFELPSRVDPV